MTREMLEANMRDFGLYTLLTFSILGGLSLSIAVLGYLDLTDPTLQPFLFSNAMSFALYMGGFFIFMHKENILSFSRSRRLWSIGLYGFFSGSLMGVFQCIWSVLFTT